MAAESHMNIPLETLLTLLRAEGFKNISTTAILDIQKVLANLDEEEIKDYRKLKYLLSPIICRNKEDQEKFSQVFNQYVSVIERETEKHDIIPEPPKPRKFVRRIVIAGLAVAFILAIIWWFLRPDPPKPNLSLSQTNYSPVVKNDEAAIGDSIGYEAYLNDTIAGEKYTVDWKLDNTSYVNSRTIRKVYSDTGSHTAYAYVKDEKGRIIAESSITTQILFEHIPSVSIERRDATNGKIYAAVAGDLSAKTNQYKYKWYINDSLTRAVTKVFQTSYRSNKPYEIKLVVDSRGLYSDKNYDTLTASIREVPDYSLLATALSSVQTSTVFQARNLIWMIVALLLIPLGVAALIFRFWKKPKPPKPADTLPVEKDKKEEHTQGPFFIEFKKQDHKISPEEQISRLADGLRKRQLNDVYKLHPKKTIQKTIRMGGFPSFEFSPKTKPVDFLILIDKEYPEGHLVKLFEYLVDRLRSEEVNITVYDYYKEPLSLNNPKFNHIHIPLDRVAQLYHDTVLFLFTTGEYFFEPLKSKLKPWAEEKFKVWDNRIIITPTPRKDWTYKESILQQSGFAVISADLYLNNLLKILLDFVNLQVETTKKNKIEMPQTYSARYFNFQEFDSLKKYLDSPELLNWVSATAVYPTVDWKVTVAIGKALEEEAKSNKLVTYENLLKISRISWMQDGIIDDSLRLEMLRHIDNITEAVARKAIVGLLEEIKEQFTEKSFAKEEFDLHQNSNRLLLHAHDKGNPVSDETVASVKEYISKGYLDWPQSVYHQEARNTLMKKENSTASVPPEEYFKSFDKDNNGKEKQEKELSKQEKELRLKEKRRKRLRNLTAAGSILLLSFIGGWLLNQNGLLQLRKILPASLQIILHQTEQLKQLGDITLSLKIDTLPVEGKRENDSVFVFSNIIAGNKGQQAMLFLEPAGGNQMFTTISSDSSYLISLAEPLPRTLYIRYNNQDFYSAIEQQISRELYRYSIDALQGDFKDSSRIIYYSEDQKMMADSIVRIMKDKFNINVRVEFIRENRTPPAAPILFLNLDKVPPCTSVAINIIPKTLNEIWIGGTNNRLITINLGQQIIYYSTDNAKTYGTYRIDEICMGSNGVYKIITRAGNQFQVFLLKNIQSSSFELSVCQNRYNTKEEARAVDERYCGKFNIMTWYYENDPGKIYLPIASENLAESQKTKFDKKADSIRAFTSGSSDYNVTLFYDDKFIKRFDQNIINQYFSKANLKFQVRRNYVNYTSSPGSLQNPFQRSYLFITLNNKGADPETDKTVQSGQILIQNSHCQTCHKVSETLTGPSYQDIARKYNYDSSETVVIMLANRVIKGSSGVWGKTPSIPHPQLSQANASLMVKYILSLKTNLVNTINLGTLQIDAKGYPDNKSLELIRTITIQLKANSNRRIRLEATYTSKTEQKNIMGYISTIKNLFYKEGINEKLQPIDDRVSAKRQISTTTQKNILNRSISAGTSINVIGINFPDNSRNKSKN